MTLKTVNVVGTMHDPSGLPANGVEGYFVLNRFEKDTGVIVPTSTYFKTDADGTFSVNIWPNARGSGGSRYILRAYLEQAILLSTEVYIPDTDVVVDFADTIIEPPYPPKDQALQVLLDIQALSIQVKSDGAEAIEAAQNALASAQEAYDSQLLAKAWAIKTDGLVDGEDYSSKHWANESQQFSESSKDSADKSELAKETSLLASVQAAAQAINADTSSIHAADMADLSEQWATKLNDTVDGVEYSAKYYANQAKTSEINAKSSEDLANTYKLEAKGYSESASASFDNINEIELLAEQYAINAANSATLANEDRIASQGFADLSSGFADEAEASKTKAQQWANNPENVPVEDGLYSALHYAMKASLSSATASQKADEASLSESNANDSRLAAKQSEDNAKESELAAKISEENALLSANQFSVNFTQMATAIINTQTIVVNHHGFGD